MRIIWFFIFTILIFSWQKYRFEHQIDKPAKNISISSTSNSGTLREDAYYLTPEENAWICSYYNSYKGPPPNAITLPSGKVIRYKWMLSQDGSYANHPLKPIRVIKQTERPEAEEIDTGKIQINENLGLFLMSAIYMGMVYGFFSCLKNEASYYFIYRHWGRSEEPFMYWLAMILLGFMIILYTLFLFGIDILPFGR